VIGSEDCLYLNVFTKRGMAGDDATLKKVMVWIHGGAFIFGGIQHYPATYFMEEDVVLVSPTL
jgi:carboxylesterase type B